MMLCVRSIPLPAKGPPRYANAANTSTLKPNLDSQTLALAGPAAVAPPNPSEPNPPVELYCAELEPMPDSVSFERYEGFDDGSIESRLSSQH